MNEKQTTPTPETKEFKPPKLYLMHLSTIFIGPALVIVLPLIFEDNNLAWTHRIIVALSLLSVGLVAMYLILSYGMFSREFDRQLSVIDLEYRLDGVQKSQTDTKNNLDDVRNCLSASISVFDFILSHPNIDNDVKSEIRSKLDDADHKIKGATP